MSKPKPIVETEMNNEPNEVKIHTNRLAKEKSPYLLQHANNPVDWYPWGEEAFERARAEDKPVFLSIGYSTCHWCHVMEEESFEDPEIGKLMNETVIAIKVDREERPDLDHIYMKAVLGMTGSGGWPMSVFLTPDKRPFFGGTYFPPKEKWGKPGFATLIKGIGEKWKTDRAAILASSEEISKLLSQSMSKTAAEVKLDEETLKRAYEQLESSFDSERGGYGGAPKFPQSHMNSFLLRYAKRSGEIKAKDMALKTLDEMIRGGIYDHIGGGFHRYSTDADWFVPHFEKMLYDQAMIAKSLTEAYQVTKKPEYAHALRETLDYILRDLTDSAGGFYSAEDADSFPADDSGVTVKREGAFYVWSEGEIRQHLGINADLFNYHYGVQPDGNVASDPHGEFQEKNILFVAHEIADVAEQFNKSREDVVRILEESVAALLEARAKRPRPHLDDKVLTDWNGLAISAFALAGRVLDEPRYTEAAKRSADFIISTMKEKNGVLLHRYREGEAGIHGFLEDYAFFSNGLIDLYESTFEVKYLIEANQVLAKMNDLFLDDEHGGFFFTADNREFVIARAKEANDGAIPSGNSVGALALFRMSLFTMEEEAEKFARNTLKAFSAEIDKYPAGYSQMLAALEYAIGPTMEIVIAGERSSPETLEMISEINRTQLQASVVALRPTGEENAIKVLDNLSPFLGRQEPLNGKTTAYVCKNFMCKLPTNDMEVFKQQLRG